MDLLPHTQFKLVLSDSESPKQILSEPTIAQKLKELFHNNHLLQYRLERQYKLVDKIKKGKWKSAQCNSELLESLARLDIDLLLKMKEENEKEQLALKKQIDNLQKENDHSNINLDS